MTGAWKADFEEDLNCMIDCAKGKKLFWNCYSDNWIWIRLTTLGLSKDDLGGISKFGLKKDFC